MELARFVGASALNTWFVVVDGQAFDFALLRSTEAGARVDEAASAVTRRQDVQMEELMELRRGNHLVTLRGLLPEEDGGRRFTVDDGVRYLPPVDAISFRDFYAFEEHVRNARKRRGLEMAPEWYDAPAFYFSNTASIVGHGAAIQKPSDTNELDYELEIAAVIGGEGRDIPVAEADDYIAGFTILNDWSARDIQRREMKVGLGPAKGKDFATSIGPYLVTPDELDDRAIAGDGRGKRHDLTMTAHVNGREYSRGNAQDMRWTFAELIAHASRNTVLRPGDLIGSGTVGTGCITEFPEGTYPWLQRGDVVRLEIERLGVLENRID